MQIVLKTILEDGKVADKDVFDFDDDLFHKDEVFVEWPKEYVHKMLFDPSFENRAEAVDQEPTDISITERYISEETCRSNLYALVATDIFPKLSVSAQAELFNKCPESVKQAYLLLGYEDKARALVKKVAALVKDPYARGYLEFKLSKEAKENRYFDFSEKLFEASYNGKPFSIGVRSVVTLLESHLYRDSLEGQRVLEAMLNHPVPEIRGAIAERLSYSGHIKKLAMDPCFSIRMKIIKNKKFELTNFTVEELLEVISEDPELAKEVIARCEYFVGIRLCEKLTESNVLEIRTMALRRLVQKPQYGVKDILEEDEDEEEEGKEPEDEDFDNFDE